MTDNQDSKIKSGAQTPPTDRPLTAGDIPLLRKGDVLRVVVAAARNQEWHSIKQPAIGEEVAFIKPSASGGVSNCIVTSFDPAFGFRPTRFTFVSRPATSAASEGRVMPERIAAVIDHFFMKPDDAWAFSVTRYAADPLHVSIGDLRALASPPVSERERELEARVAELGAQIAWRTDDAPKDGSVIYGHVWSPYRWLPYKPNSEQAKRGAKGRWQTMNEYGGWENAPPPPEWATEDQIAARRSLTAQPAGEGK